MIDLISKSEFFAALLGAIVGAILGGLVSDRLGFHRERLYAAREMLLHLETTKCRLAAFLVEDEKFGSEGYDWDAPPTPQLLLLTDPAKGRSLPRWLARVVVAVENEFYSLVEMKEGYSAALDKLALGQVRSVEIGGHAIARRDTHSKVVAIIQASDRAIDALEWYLDNIDAWCQTCGEDPPERFRNLAALPAVGINS